MAFLDGKNGFLSGLTSMLTMISSKEFATALDDIQMPVGDGVKRTGVDGASHVRHVKG